MFLYAEIFSPTVNDENLSYNRLVCCSQGLKGWTDTEIRRFLRSWKKFAFDPMNRLEAISLDAELTDKGVSHSCSLLLFSSHNNLVLLDYDNIFSWATTILSSSTAILFSATAILFSSTTIGLGVGAGRTYGHT